MFKRYYQGEPEPTTTGQGYYEVLIAISHEMS